MEIKAGGFEPHWSIDDKVVIKRLSLEAK